jgi:reactive chlorine resistance protein C
VNWSDSDRRRPLEVGVRVQAVGALILRYGLVLVIAWIGLMKFTQYEAKGIQHLSRIAH